MPDGSYVAPKFRHLILDRDGVLNREAAIGWVTELYQWEWEVGLPDALDALARSGIRVSVVTNQSCVGRGLASAKSVDELHDWLTVQMHSRGITMVGIFCCPHGPDNGCRCRKPLPGLLHDAIAASGVPPSETMMVGDDLSDQQAARSAGIESALVLTGKGRRISGQIDESTRVFANLAELLRRVDKEVPESLSEL